MPLKTLVFSSENYDCDFFSYFLAARFIVNSNLVLFEVCHMIFGKSKLNDDSKSMFPTNSIFPLIHLSDPESHLDTLKVDF